MYKHVYIYIHIYTYIYIQCKRALKYKNLAGRPTPQTTWSTATPTASCGVPLPPLLLPFSANHTSVD